jgi:hypothetical protein
MTVGISDPSRNNAVILSVMTRFVSTTRGWNSEWQTTNSNYTCNQKNFCVGFSKIISYLRDKRIDGCKE